MSSAPRWSLLNRVGWGEEGETKSQRRRKQTDKGEEMRIKAAGIQAIDSIPPTGIRIRNSDVCA